MTLQKAIRDLAGSNKASTVNLEECSVVSYDELARTCIVTTTSGKGDITRTEVRLMADIDDGLLYLPAIDSSVIVAYSDFVAPFVMYFSEIDKILFIVGDSAIEISPNTITLNDGSYGGLVIIGKLVTEINNLKSVLNGFIATYNIHSHPSNGSPTGNQQTTTSPATNQSDIENTNVIHGSSI